MKKRLFMFSVMLLSIMQVALAQVTTAALTGKVTLDNTNEEVIGCTTLEKVEWICTVSLRLVE